MKKLLLLLLTLTLIFSFAACQSKPSGADPTETGNNKQNENLEGSLEDILNKIYDTAKVDDNFKAYIKDGLLVNEINNENCAYHLGKEGIEFESAIASVPEMSTSAYELDLVRVKEGADIEKIKGEIKENVDPRKWICVGVEPENVIVDNIGDVIIVIMTNENGKALHDAFLALKD
ncbi:MAG: hypothetical protein ACOYIG_05205 [Acetivibrionales bacterium]|jgi:hypothetical protein|nr:hypothetical protein [Clostridiaceae bacterium]